MIKRQPSKDLRAGPCGEKGLALFEYRNNLCEVSKRWGGGRRGHSMGRRWQDTGWYPRMGGLGFMSSAVTRCWGVLRRGVMRPD